MLQEGGGVMADRGFLVHDLLVTKKVHLICPAYCKGCLNLIVMKVIFIKAISSIVIYLSTNTMQKKSTFCIQVLPVYGHLNSTSVLLQQLQFLMPSRVALINGILLLINSPGSVKCMLVC